MTNNVLFGSAIGLSLWLANILSMEGIIMRQDDKGNYVITPGNIIEYFKLPFDQNKKNVAWGMFPKISIKERLNCLTFNWIFMMCLGGSIGLFYSFI